MTVLSITFLVANAAASLARNVPLAMSAANSAAISSCTLLQASPRGSAIPLLGLTALADFLFSSGLVSCILDFDPSAVTLLELGFVTLAVGWTTEGGLNCGA